MKRTTGILVALIGIVLLAACDHHETYADQKKRERNAIAEFISKKAIKTISENQFKEQGNTTDVSQNEYVLFENTGVYMQIVQKGTGEQIKEGETTTVLCRFNEYNLLTDSLQLTNNSLYFSALVDKMNVQNNSGSFTASFDSNSSVMYRAYGSTSVPAGWLVPFTYINLDRYKEGSEIAQVNLIVPHTQGHQYASSGVYPCYYELTYDRGR
jgi:hypothetical protein